MSLAKHPIRIAIVAGEMSGDTLGAGLIAEIKKHCPSAVITGIAGPKMVAAGCEPLFHIDEITTIGLFEALKDLPRIMRIRYQLYKFLRDNPPDVFVGVDAPAFNLGLERKLRAIGVRTVHYNSPKIWAWRPKRIHKIATAVDLMLTLLPFESSLYEEHRIPVKYVGHPLADAIPLKNDMSLAREALDIPVDKRVLTVLPGSRALEIAYLGPIFIETIIKLRSIMPNLHVVVPLANDKRAEQFKALVPMGLDLHLVSGSSLAAMAAGDAVLLASGTATLEAMLLKKPMVVAYRVSALTHLVLRRLIKVKYAALPNLLADKELVPEFIQHHANPNSLARELLKRLRDPSNYLADIEQFNELHCVLRQGASREAARAVLSLTEETI